MQRLEHHVVQPAVPLARAAAAAPLLLDRVVPAHVRPTRADAHVAPRDAFGSQRAVDAARRAAREHEPVHVGVGARGQERRVVGQPKRRVPLEARAGDRVLTRLTVGGVEPREIDGAPVTGSQVPIKRDPAAATFAIGDELGAQEREGGALEAEFAGKQTKVPAVAATACRRRHCRRASLCSCAGRHALVRGGSGGIFRDGDGGIYAAAHVRRLRRQQS
mmetsp:Transcript_18891/g.43392  ORF Transcript_18891/g.43392 Transcript_18891/m.43392 type:complete len:219 (-) Transcript_18891:28-684(-)